MEQVQMASDADKSPIELLLSNVAWAFENPDSSFPDRLKAAVEDGSIQSDIALQMDFIAPRSPSLSRDPGEDRPKICLHITFLELLWASIYGWMVIYEDGIQKPMLAGTYSGAIKFETPELVRANHLIDWAKLMAKNYRSWPENLPAPNRYATEREKWYGEKANRVFQEAASFCLIHEFSHASYDHLTVVGDYQGDWRLQIKLELEKDADNAAFNTLVPNGLDETERLSKGWAILGLMLTSFYLANGVSGIFQRGHLPLHHRLDHLRRYLNFQEEKHRFYFDYLCSTFLELFIREAGLDCEPRIFETAQDALDAKLNLLDGYMAHLTS